MRPEIKLHTRTNEYVQVIINGELVKADIQYDGKMPVCWIDGTCYVVSRFK